ncbi:protein SET DOMAIN GROUP 41 [Typha angustifolia]|uniref:protein SET DOMAIN GROUP 41 n=1 Tax=Typha angustifolia TaxID=59011 RepID=UPI003C2D8125
MAMEMRASENISMSQDLTPSIHPCAAALHDSFLYSHCSSCFRVLPSHFPAHSLNHQEPFNSIFPISCTTCKASIRYCSAACFASDSVIHSSSGECHFLLQFTYPSTCSLGDDTADIRAALRLLYFFEVQGYVPSPPWTELPNRIGGLLVSDLKKVLKGGVVAERIREAGSLMSCARRRKRAEEKQSYHRSVMVEEVALWAVMTNSVEVQINEEWALGLAVYGPCFSWFNHSCLPNACYRFELASWCKDHLPCELGSFWVSPASTGETPTLVWNYEDVGLSQGLSTYGPRIVVRSIKEVKKGEEVCITYTDLLQPKAARQSDLWSNYRFICCCQRCTMSPEIYIDYMLNFDERNLNLGNSNSAAVVCEELADVVNQAIAEYASDDDPKACCDKLESTLYQSLQYEDLQKDKLSGRQFILHPLHYLSLKAYMTLASAYRLRAQGLCSTDLHIENNYKTFKMSRAAAAYSLLLAGATHRLLLSESSFIAVTSHFLVSAGETTLNLVRSSTWQSSGQRYESNSSFNLVSCYEFNLRKGSLPWFEFKLMSMQFAGCISTMLLYCWPFLIEGFLYLEKIKNPFDLSWLDMAMLQAQCSLGEGTTTFSTCKCFACDYQSDVFLEDKVKCLYQLAIHLLSYGGYLASICYGPQCYLVDHARDLLKVEV